MRLQLATAGIKRMINEGVWVKQLRYQTAPTVTSVGHATLATGAWPQTHGIVSNEWFDEVLGRKVLSTEDLRFQILGRPPALRDCTSPSLLKAPTSGWSLGRGARSNEARQISSERGLQRTICRYRASTNDSSP